MPLPQPYARLHSGYAILPIPEFLSICIGVILLIIAPDELSNQNFLGTSLALYGVVSLVIGWPLLFARINIFWPDIAYIVGGAILITYLVIWEQEMTVFGLISMFLGPGMIFAGLSHLIRRAIAFYLASRKEQNTAVEH